MHVQVINVKPAHTVKSKKIREEKWATGQQLGEAKDLKQKELVNSEIRGLV